MRKAVAVTAMAGLVVGGVAAELAGAPAQAQRDYGIGRALGRAVASRVQADCPSTMPNGVQVLTCSCINTGSSASAWGTGVYTADSNICLAAQHDGAVDRRGIVTVYTAPGRASYRGSMRNGVETRNWGQYTRSITFHSPDDPRADGNDADGPGISRVEDCPNSMPGGVRSLTCSCLNTGSSASAWGTGVYTADSNICLAAQHDGAVDPNGNVTVFNAPGRASYRGSMRNGVETRNWGQYTRSITFAHPR